MREPNSHEPATRCETRRGGGSPIAPSPLSRPGSPDPRASSADSPVASATRAAAAEPIAPRWRGSDAPSARDAVLLERTRAALALLFGPIECRGFGVRLWNGVLDVPPGGSAPRFTLVLPRPESLRRIFLPPSELRMGEAFVRGDFDVEGDLEAATALADDLRARLTQPAALARLTRSLLALPGASVGTAGGARRSLESSRLLARHSRQRDAAAVRSHYDVGNDFYALWLDAELVYSCAYFGRASNDIGTAQRRKLDHLCRKLRLRPGERLLDIGCGWGALIRHAVRHYGVTALGVTLSAAQAALARERIERSGLAGRCAVEVRDYRALDARQRFDKIVSVGMVEHVGCAELAGYFQRVWRLLEPGGLFLNHGIVQSPRARPRCIREWLAHHLWRRGAFVGRYVFPDGELPALEEIVRCAEHAGFETRDVENLREHYALTLRHWVRRLERERARAVALVGEPTYRVWRLYMAASARAFASARQGLAQVLLAKPAPGGAVPLPLTRADLYRRRGSGAVAGAQPRLA